MATEDVKNFLVENTGIPKSNWKRLSKHKSDDGSEIRMFQDKVSGKVLKTIEDKNGKISISDSAVVPTKSKIVGYYQFDDEQFSVALVTKEFWKENQCLDDSGSQEEYVPEHFFELTDAIYEHDFDTHEEACAALEKAGWVARKFLDEMNN
jgi:hypothetical protein